MRRNPANPMLPTLLLLALGGAATVAAAGKDSVVRSYEDAILPLLTRHCLECHGAEKSEGDLRLDQLATDFADRDRRATWFLVRKRVAAGEMPPEGEPRLPGIDVETLTRWIADGASAAVVRERAAAGRVVLRRLNRVEYENTVRDLLGVSVDVQALLPEDTESDGFDNVGAALHTSSFLMERYLEAADKALGYAIANVPQPPLLRERYDCADTHQVKSDTERVYLHRDDELVFFSSSAWNTVVLSPFYPPDRGLYRIRISAQAYQNGESPVVYRVDAGPMLMATKNVLVGYFDAPAAEPAVVEFTIPLEARSTIRISPYGLATAQVVSPIGADAYQGPGLAVQWVDVEGPLNDTWPPESHRRIFGNLPQEPTKNDPYRLEVVSSNPEADAERILRDFARRAFRRAVADDDLLPIVALVRAKLAEGHSFEQAVRVGLLAVMVSPRFLFLDERPGRLDDFALASRLSYFLWCTMPDDELLRLAEEGKLSQPDELRRQVERMLDDPKSAAFTRNFVGQWLALRDIDFTEPTHILYPEFDDMLRESMIRETELFFAEVLADDLPLTNFVHSDFTMLNGRLARHYGIPGVEGWAFQKTPLPPESHRGGVLTMASVLKVTANGTATSPVLRGAWVLERILGVTPPRPPADVPALEPDIRGATTIREQLALHRDSAACASCHAQIDPPGFALESFDVIGGFREHYRTSGNGEPVEIDGRQMPYYRGLAVDPSGELADGRTFAGIDEFKQLLLADPDQLARALTVKLVTYSTGGPPEEVDEPEIDRIVRATAQKNYGFRTLVQAIVASPLFREK